jgi:hypothetical protein
VLGKSLPITVVIGVVAWERLGWRLEEAGRARLVAQRGGAGQGGAGSTNDDFGASGGFLFWDFRKIMRSGPYEGF